jgi:hypothetical protein
MYHINVSDVFFSILLAINKTSMVKDIGAFRDSQTPSWLSGLRTMYLLNLPLIGPA